MARCSIWNTEYISGRSNIYADKFSTAMIIAGAAGGSRPVPTRDSGYMNEEILALQMGWRRPCLAAIDDGNGREETVSMKSKLFVERVMFRKEKVFYFFSSRNGRTALGMDRQGCGDDWSLALVLL